MKWQFFILLQLILWNSLGQNIPIPDGHGQDVEIKKYPIEWDKLNSQVEGNVDTLSTAIKSKKISGFKLNPKGGLIVKKIEPISNTISKIEGLSQRDNAILNIQYLSKRNGLNHKGVNSLDSDNNNNLYLASGNMFSIFNGRYIKSYNLPGIVDGIQDVTCLKNRVWLASRSGLFYFEKDQFYSVQQFDKIPVALVSIDSSNMLWVSTDKHGLYNIDSQNNLAQLFHPQVSVYFKRVFDDSRGNKWLAFNEGVIKMGAEDTLFYDFKTAGYRFPLSFLEHRGKILVGTFLGGMLCIDRNRVLQIDLGIEENSVHDMLEANGNIWLAVFGRGVTVIHNNGNYSSLNSMHGMPSNSAHKLCKDRYNQVWISSLEEGLIKIEEEHFLPSKPFVGSGQILCVAKKDSVRYYFRSIGGVIKKSNNLLEEMIIPKSFGRIPYHKQGDVIDANHIWLETYDGGFVQYTDNMLVSYQHSNDELEYQTHTPVQDKWGRVWATKYLGDVKYLLKGKVYTPSKLSSDFRSSRGFIKSKDRECYYIKENELYLITKNELVRLNLPNGRIKTIFQNENGGLWLLRDNVLYEILGSKVKKISVIEELKGVTINNAIQVHQSIYFSGEKSILKWDLKTKAKANIINVGYLFQNGNLIRDGDEILYTSNAGNLVLRENWNEHYDNKPSISVFSIRLNGKEISISDKFKISPSDKLKIQLEYDFLQGKQKLEYSLAHMGVNGGWNAITEDYVLLENLAPGEYSLKLRNKLINGKSSMISIGLTVNPYWYQRTWFLITVGLFLLSVVFIGFRLRVKRLNARREKLEELIKEKTKEIEQKKNQVEVELKAKEVLLKEVNHRVKNNMQMVSSILELQKSKNKNLEGKEAIDIAIKRVKALSIAHQHLYQGEDYQNIYINDYLQVILDNLTSQTDVNLICELVKCKFDIEKAQALGLILNELIQNSLKHAWPHGDMLKEIDVKLEKIKDSLKFTYQDNGVGIDSKNKSVIGLGKTLMKAIVSRQLEGDYRESFNGGYQLVINFNLDHEENINR